MKIENSDQQRSFEQMHRFSRRFPNICIFCKRPTDAHRFLVPTGLGVGERGRLECVACNLCLRRVARRVEAKLAGKLRPD